MTEDEDYIAEEVLRRDASLQQLAAAVCDVLDTPLCLVWVLDEETSRLKVQAWHGPLDEIYRRVTIDYDSLATRRFLQIRQPVSFDDVTNSQTAKGYQHRAEARQRDWRSLLSAPMISQDRVTGILDTYSIGQSRHFSDGDKRLLHILANQAALVVENAHLREQLQKQKQIRTLNRVGQMLNSVLDLDYALVATLGEVTSLMDALAATIWLLDPVSGELICSQNIGPHTEMLRDMRLGRGVGIAGWVAEHGQSLRVPDTRLEPRHFKDIDKMTRVELRSILCVPLQTQNKIIGALQALDTQADHFSETDLVTLESVAAWAAVAIENSRLFEEQSRRAEWLVELQQITRDILAASPPLETSLCAIAERIAALFNATWCSFRLYDPGLGQFGGPIAPEALHEWSSRPPRPDGTSHYLAHHKQALYAENPSANIPGCDRPIIREEVQSEGVKAAAYVPLLSEGQLIGRLAAYWKWPHPFSDDDKRVLEMFADQAAITVIIRAR